MPVETVGSKEAPRSQLEFMKDSAEPHPQLDERCMHVQA